MTGQTAPLTYAEALELISKEGRFAMKLGIERTRALLDHLGSPDSGLRGALIAGTNGKGSTGAILSSILRAGGGRVGFMPKPHLVSYTERIEIDGRPISEDDFAASFASLRPVFDAVAKDLGPPTEFEMLTVLAVAYLAPRVDVLVCEVGLGGRLDATNALDLGVAVVTNVDLDHQKYLGSTIGEIAREKAAIIKAGDRALTGCKGEALEIVQERARDVAAELWRLGREVTLTHESLGWAGHRIDVSGPGFAHRDLHLPLLGDYQPDNAALAIAAAHLIGVDDAAVREGLAGTQWPGRLQVVAQRPRVVVDGGHNPAALRRAGAALRRLIGDGRLVVVFGMLSERDPVQLVAALRELAPYGAVFTEAESAHGHVIEPQRLAEIYGAGAEVARPARAAVDRAREMAGGDGTVLVCGSLYLVGEVLALMESNRRNADTGTASRRSSAAGATGRAPRGTRRR